MSERITWGPAATPSFARDLGCRICWQELGDTISVEVNHEQAHNACYEAHKAGHPESVADRYGERYTQCGFCRNARHYGTVNTLQTVEVEDAL